MKQLKPIQLFEGNWYDEQHQIDFALFTWEFSLSDGKLYTDELFYDSSLIEVISDLTDDRNTHLGIGLDIYDEGVPYVYPHLILYGHVKEELIILEDELKEYTRGDAIIQYLQQAYTEGKIKLFVEDVLEYKPHPQVNEYWEEGLTKLVTEICPLEECDDRTQQEIVKFATANQMTKIIEYILEKNIKVGISSDYKRIAGTALKGNHKLR